MAWSKEYRAEYMRRYREGHKAQAKANRRYYYRRNKAKENANAKIWFATHRERWNAYQRERLNRMKQQPCTSSADCTTCEYAYHDNGYNECSVDGVKPLGRRDNEKV